MRERESTTKVGGKGYRGIGVLRALDLAVGVNQNSQQHVEENEKDNYEVAPYEDLKGPIWRRM